MPALVREVKEEVGCEIKVSGEVGEIIEYRLDKGSKSKYKLKQVSYCYYGEITKKGKPSFTKKELANGFQIKWFILEDALTALKNDKPKTYTGNFIQQRDLKFLEETKEILTDL